MSFSCSAVCKRYCKVPISALRASISFRYFSDVSESGGTMFSFKFSTEPRSDGAALLCREEGLLVFCSPERMLWVDWVARNDPI